MIVWAVEAMEVCTGRGSNIYIYCIVLIKAFQTKEIVDCILVVPQLCLTNLKQKKLLKLLVVFWWFLSSFSPVCLYGVKCNTVIF
jgi:hypothetical protein